MLAVSSGTDAAASHTIAHQAQPQPVHTDSRHSGSAGATALADPESSSAAAPHAGTSAAPAEPTAASTAAGAATTAYTSAHSGDALPSLAAFPPLPGVESFPGPTAGSSNDPINLDYTKEKVIYHPTPLTSFGYLTITAATHIGRRKNQEDRMLVAPALMNGELSFFGVFDGTVQEHASEWVHRNIVRVLYSCPSFLAFCRLSPADRADPKSRAIFAHAVKECYAQTDAELLEFCRVHEHHYTSCTSITVFLHHPSQTLYCAHLADSHAVVGIPTPNAQGRLVGQLLTLPHRPDTPAELERIRRAGGTLVYLHTNKPFIRGGDFHQRKLAMQLNYSRAFGGKDLKPFGLSAEPDIRVIEVKMPSNGNKLAPPSQRSGEDVRALILGSDGLWDVVSPSDAVKAASYLMAVHCGRAQAQAQAADPAGAAAAAAGVAGDREFREAAEQFGDKQLLTPSEYLVQLALENHVIKGSNDNVTSIVVFF
jgi:protein phosphatase